MSFIKKLFIKNLRASVFVATALFAFFMHGANAHAATLTLSPSAGTFTEGKSFSVRVLVGSGGESVNAVSGKINFSTDTLTLTSLSKSGVVSLWAQEPTYSNSSGAVSFQGVMLNGYSGSSGTVITMTFRAKAPGTGTVSISTSGSSVLLNDGQGTNALSSAGSASFTIAAAAVKPTTPTPTPTPTPKPTTPEPEPVVPEPVVVPPPVVTTVIPLVFTDYQTILAPGSFIVAKGTAPANSMVMITLTRTAYDGTTSVSQIPILATQNGTFTFVSEEKVAEGSGYSLVASVDGQHTAPLKMTVKNSFGFIVSGWVAALLAVKISLVLALAIIILLVWWLSHRNAVLKRQLREVAMQVHQDIH